MADQASSSITIQADQATVMGIIADFPAYPEWTGSIKKAEVVEEGADGRAKQVHFKLDAGVIRDDYVLEYDWHADDEVHWHLVKGGMLKGMDGTYALRDTGDGSTEVVYRLSVDLSMPMIGMIRRKAEKVIIDTALKELKKRAER
jgi:ribosome-associated toxin RatA of RatAB toxin-antitoxin module